MCVIKLMPNESIGGFVIRYLLLSGNANQKDVSRFLFTKVTGQWRVFPHIDENIKKYFNYEFYENDSGDVLLDSTLIPLYRITGHWDFLGIYQKLLLSKKGQDAYTYFQEEAASTAETMVVDIKFCPTCFKEQIRSEGFAWFKRNWLIPGMNACERHYCRLLNATLENQDQYKNGLDLAVTVLQADPSKYHVERLRPEDRNPYYEWVINVLERGLPPFSPKLRIFLMQQTCMKLGADETWSSRRMADLLAHTYYSEGHPWQCSGDGKQDELKDSIYKRCFQEALWWSGYGENFHPHTHIIPFVCLLYPLSWVFPDFEDFIQFLERVSCKKTHYSLSGKSIPILDLKSSIEIIRQKERFRGSLLNYAESEDTRA